MKRRTFAVALLAVNAAMRISAARAQERQFYTVDELEQIVRDPNRLELVTITVSTLRVILALSQYGDKASAESILKDPNFNHYRALLASPQGRTELLQRLATNREPVGARLAELREKTLPSVLERLKSVVEQACGPSDSPVSVQFQQTFIQFTELVEVVQPREHGRGWWCDCYGLSLLCG